MFLTGKYQGRHRETRGRETQGRETQGRETQRPETLGRQARGAEARGRETQARSRVRFGLGIVAAIACAALLTAWPAPRYN